MRRAIKTAVFLLVAIACIPVQRAEAVRSFTIDQSPASVEFVMGSSNNPITFHVANNSTAGETIRSVRFTISTTYTSLPNPETFTAPAGWTCARSSNTRITCTAGSATSYLGPGDSGDFTFDINSVASNRDRTTNLSSAQALFVGSGTWRTPNSTTSSWTWKALLMTLTPSPTGVGSGCQFTLTMNVTNESTQNNLTISPVPSPRPTASTSGGASVDSPSPVPSSLTLNAGASGSIVWTYTLSGPAGGAVSLTACASTTGSCSTAGASRTSLTVTSAAITVMGGVSCGLSSSLTSSQACLFSGDIATFQMLVTNTTGGPVTAVTPSTLTRIVTGNANIGSFTGPTPASIASLPSPSTGTFTWTAVVTGDPNTTYAVQGYATAAGPLQTATTQSPVQDIDGYVVTVGATNADSTNAELTWTVRNSACSKVDQVGIAMPDTVNWTYGNDGYALVHNVAGNADDSWSLTYSAGTATFTAQAAADRIPPPPVAPPLNEGTYSLLFSQTPATAGTYTFIVTVVDDAIPPVSRVKQTAVTVNPFDPAGPNATTGTGVWREDEQ